MRISRNNPGLTPWAKLIRPLGSGGGFLFRSFLVAGTVAFGFFWFGCSPSPPPKASSTASPPSILLVTLDTTRADRTGLETNAVVTPHLKALATRGVTFSQAYATAPMTLPSHTSMMTGLYPAGHGIRENARHVGREQVLLAERLREKGYRTTAVVSALPLAGQFGLARGFDRYDDNFGKDSGAAERSAGETTDQALSYLATDLEQHADAPVFFWVHYFDAHEPYAAPEPFGSRYPSDPYLAEIAYMDQELGRLLAGFESRFRDGDRKILLVGDHGEGLGDHGEALHGNLLYQGVMRVPLVVAGSGIAPGRREQPVSVRRVFDTVLTWAGFERQYDLLTGAPEPVLGEAMKPFLQYGWQPQVMAVHGDLKVIRSGGLEVYDVRADPGETRNLSDGVELSAELRTAIQNYPFLPKTQVIANKSIRQEEREKLASLGYVDWQGEATLQENAPSPKDMAPLFADLDLGSGLFVRGEYEQAIAVFEKVAEQDPRNLMVCLRLAVAHSVSGHGGRAEEYFSRARTLAPDSVDVDHYLAMHHFRAGRGQIAGPLFEKVLARLPEKLPALESLGQIRMASGDTPGALDAFERTRALQGEDFAYFLELGVLYLAEGRFEEARDCLDQVREEHPAYAMVLFKRAQVSVLLAEADRGERVRRARERADASTRPLIAKERLFRGL